MSLQQIIVILWARKWITILAVVTAVAAAITAIGLLPPRYNASTSVLIDVSEPDPVTGQVLPSPLVRNNQRTQIALLTSERVALDVVRRLDLTRDPQYKAAFDNATDGGADLARWIADRIQEGLHATFADGSNVMVVSYTANSPQVAAVMANTFKAAYLAANLEIKVEPAQRNAQWFATQIDGLRRDLEDARHRLAEFQERNKLLVQSQGEVENANLVALNARLQESRAALITAENQLFGGTVMFGDGGSEGGSAIGMTAESATLAQLVNALAVVDAEISRISGSAGPNNPKLAALNAERAMLRRRVQEEEAAVRKQREQQIEGLRKQVASIEEEISRQRDDMLSQQSVINEYERLQREVAFRQQQLDEVQQRTASFRMQGQQSFVNVVPLDEASPPVKPAFPKKAMILALALGMGGALGIILSVLIEMLDRRIRTVNDLQYASGVKPIGMLASATATSGRLRRRDRIRRRLARLLPVGKTRTT